MAGMFSMLNKKLGVGGSNTTNHPSREDGNGFKTHQRGPPSSSSKSQTLNCNSCSTRSKTWNTHSREMGVSSRLCDIHPELRRSVCTLIIASVCVICGVITILIELLVVYKNTSIAGWIVFGVGLFLVLTGFIWFYLSKRKLETKWEIWEKEREKKLNNALRSCDKEDFLPFTLLTSKHVAKWPTKVTCLAAECQEANTSPNGNHYVTPSLSSRSDDDELIESTSYPVKVATQFHGNERSGYYLNPQDTDRLLAPVNGNKPRTENCGHPQIHDCEKLTSL